MTSTRALFVSLLALLLPAAAHAQDSLSGSLVVFNAGSLARPFHALLAAFAADHPGVRPAQENSGSLEAARKLTDLGKIPDVLGVADYHILPSLIVPRFAPWYLLFARNRMVIIYSGQSIGAREINGQNWWRVVQRPGVRAGRSEPALDPNGYRTLMVFQLAERYYRRPGLEARLLRAFPKTYMRPKEADLTALVQAGELDYAFSYVSIARASGLRYVTLPDSIDLGDPSLARWYSEAAVRLPGATRKDTVTFRGEPIVYGLTIPADAPHPALARAFVRFALSRRGEELMREAGLEVLESPVIRGREAPNLK